MEKVASKVPVEQITHLEGKYQVAIQKRMTDRMRKVLQCSDLKHGDVWKSRLFALRFESPKSCVTLEKLKLLAMANLRMEKKLAFLTLMEVNRVIKDMYFMLTCEFEYRRWILIL